MFSIIGTIIKGIGIGAKIGLDIYQQRKSEKAQKEMMRQQQEAAEKVAAMQNQTVVQTAPTPTTETEDAVIAEQNDYSAKKRAFSFAKTRRSGSVARRNLLG